MLGFGKKKKKDPDQAAPAAPDPNPGKKGAKKTTAPSPEPEPAPPKKKKRFTIKKLGVILMVLGAVGGSAFFVYTRYFTDPAAEKQVYKPVPLAHVTLPEEMVAFCFTHFPDLYTFLIEFNTQVTLFDREIARIEAIAKKYPDQRKIADAEKKIWEKGKNTLIKEFSKIEKPVKETYVLFRVNQARGLEQIEAQTRDLTGAAQAAVKTAQEQTGPVKAALPQAPEGIFKGTLYKLKKKFL